MPSRLLQGLQQSIARLESEQLRARNDRDPPGRLVRTPGAENQCLPNAIDTDPDAFGLDGKHVRMKTGEDSPARRALQVGILLCAEQSSSQPESFLAQRIGRGAAEQERAWEVLGLLTEALEQRRPRHRPNRSERCRQVCSNTRSGSSAAGIRRTR